MKTDIRLSETTEQIVRADPNDVRPWMQDAPVCSALGRHRIVHVGVADVVHPYGEERPSLSGTFVMACTAGEGEVLLDGVWSPIRPGSACLAPPHAFHSYRSIQGKPWKIVWVRYQEPEQSSPIVSTRAPLVADFDGEPLRLAILGLHREASTKAKPVALQYWVDLLQYYVDSFIEIWKTDDRLGAVWSKVHSALEEDWPLERLAGIAGLGGKQFSRLCVESVARTPAQHVAWIRIQRAAHLLSHTKDKVETIAHAVGYRSLTTFSHKFQQLTGQRPSAYRGT
ncbi:MAG: AraC family transcriptional regulator [Verrucomicrobiota bacterium]